MLEKFLAVLTAMAASLASIAESLKGAQLAPNAPAPAAPAKPAKPEAAPAPAAETVIDDLGLGADLDLGLDPPAPEVKKYTQAEVMNIARDTATKKGRPVIAASLKKFKATDMGSLKEEDYPAFVKLLEEAKAPAAK